MIPLSDSNNTIPASFNRLFQSVIVVNPSSFCYIVNNHLVLKNTDTLQNLRGQGAEGNQIIIAEEGNFIHPKVMKVSIVPVAMMKNSLFWFISSKSPGESAQHAGLMKTIQKSGEFRIHNIVTVCAECRRNGVIGDCMHSPRPAWKSTGGQSRKVQILMMGDEATAAREIHNIELDADIAPAFCSASIDLLWNDPEKRDYDSVVEPEIVFVAIDPSAGGKKSRYAIVSCVFQTLVVGSEATAVVCLFYQLFVANHVTLWCNTLDSVPYCVNYMSCDRVELVSQRALVFDRLSVSLVLRRERIVLSLDIA